MTTSVSTEPQIAPSVLAQAHWATAFRQWWQAQKFSASPEKIIASCNPMPGSWRAFLRSPEAQAAEPMPVVDLAPQEVIAPAEPETPPLVTASNPLIAQMVSTLPSAGGLLDVAGTVTQAQTLANDAAQRMADLARAISALAEAQQWLAEQFQALTRPGG